MIQQEVHLRVETCASTNTKGVIHTRVFADVACLLHRQVEDAPLEEAEASAAPVKEVKPDLWKH